MLLLSVIGRLFYLMVYIGIACCKGGKTKRVNMWSA